MELNYLLDFSSKGFNPPATNKDKTKNFFFSIGLREDTQMPF